MRYALLGAVAALIAAAVIMIVVWACNPVDEALRSNAPDDPQPCPVSLHSPKGGKIAPAEVVAAQPAPDASASDSGSTAGSDEQASQSSAPADFASALKTLSAQVATLQERMKLGDPDWHDEAKADLLSKLREILGPDWKKALLDGCAASPATPESDFVFYIFTVLGDPSAVSRALDSLELFGFERLFPNYYLARNPSSEAAAQIRRLLSGPGGDFKGKAADGLLHPAYLAMARGNSAEASAYFCDKARFATSAEARKTFLGHLSLVANIAEMDQVTAMLRSEPDQGARIFLVRALARMKGKDDEEVKALIEWSYHERDPAVRAAVAGLMADKAPWMGGMGGSGASSIRLKENPKHEYVPGVVLFRFMRDLHSAWFDFTVRARYVSRMEHVPGWTRIVDALEDMMQDPSADVRKAVSAAMADVGQKAKTLESEEVAIERVRLNLQAVAGGDQDPGVREHAAKLLEKLDRE